MSVCAEVLQSAGGCASAGEAEPHGVPGVCLSARQPRELLALRAGPPSSAALHLPPPTDVLSEGRAPDSVHGAGLPGPLPPQCPPLPQHLHHQDSVQVREGGREGEGGGREECIRVGREG